MNAAATKQSKVVVERSYRARVEELWDLWTTKDGFESWWGPEGFRVEVQALDARVGGELRYDMIADTPEMVAEMERIGQAPRHGTHGRFTVVERHRRLAVTHAIDFIAGVAAYEHTMLVELFPSGDTVRMVVTIDPHVDAHWTRMATEGFTSQLGKLDRRFARA
jgi:uncharacterized protein YndB with AHSA1/START domain